MPRNRTSRTMNTRSAAGCWLKAQPLNVRIKSTHARTRILIPRKCYSRCDCDARKLTTGHFPLAFMIAHLRGRLIAKHPNQATVEAGGVGYDLVISVPTFSDLPAVGS